ncbi:MAG: hypothetical protein HY020_15485 [Burkholderiales bacterium]|nr:hypothetical protein [Burkholderiales bacterium]
MAVDDLTFARFVVRHSAALHRISRSTRGEESPESVQAEAWLMLRELESKGIAINLDQAEHCSMVLAYLYQKLVRYTELHIRHAVRLDHGADGAEEGAMHPLAYRLAADEHYDPARSLARREEEQQRGEEMLDPHRSLAGAYLELLARCGNEMPRAANHLMISLSYCYRRFARARYAAAHQHDLPPDCLREQAAFVPRPWRRYRLLRAATQLCLDFEEPRILF